MLRPIPMFTALVVLCSLMTGCITSIPSPTRTTALNIPPDSRADPAVWGVYSRLVSHRFNPPSSGFPGYKLEWTQPGQEIQETLLYLPGAFSHKVFWTRHITRGRKPGELISEDRHRGLKWLGTIEADGSVLFVGNDRAGSYRMGLTERGELLHQDVDVTSEGKLAKVNYSTPYPILDMPTQLAAAQPLSPLAAVAAIPAPAATKASAEPEGEAMIEDRKAAKRGDANAQYRLGKRFADADGPAKDDAQAAFWFGKAAAQGHAAAQRDLGHQYRWGKGVPKNDIHATYWLRQAAEQGDADGQFWLGHQYERGKGVPKDVELAMEWYRKAADKSEPTALLYLGHKYRRGEGVPEDDARALAMYRKAADQGDSYGQLWVGRVYDKGEGVPVDGVQAVYWYKKAAEQGNPIAMNNLGVIYADQHNDALAEIWYRKAIQNGDKLARSNLDALHHRQANARQAYEDDEPAVGGAQLFMGALGAFSQAYGGALAEQAATDAKTRAMINQISANARAEERRRQAAAREQQQAAYEQQAAQKQQQQFALQQQAEQQRQAQQVAQQGAERERQQQAEREHERQAQRQAEQKRLAALIATPEAIYACTLPNAGDGKFRCMGPVSGGISGGPKNSLPEWRSPQAMLASSRHECPSPRRLQSSTHLVWGCGFGATGIVGYIDRSAGVDVAGRNTYYCTQRQTSCRRTSR